MELREIRGTGKVSKERVGSPLLFLATAIAVAFGLVLGVPTTGRADEPELDTADAQAVEALAASGLSARQLVQGGDFGAAVTTDGSLYMWGSNEYLQIGPYSLGTSVTTPQKVERLPPVEKVALGGQTSAALTTDGDVYTWGNGGWGQLGYDNPGDGPKRVEGLSNVVDIALGSNFGAAVTANGELYTWGRNELGQLGDGTTNNHATPRKVSGLPAVKAVALGYEHGAALTTTGAVYTWGGNWYGQLGQGTRSDYRTPNPTPKRVEGLPAIASISLGNNHSGALATDGTLYLWGCDGNWALGNGNAESAKSPLVVEGLPPVASFALGDNASAALTASGDLYLWGANSTGQQGDGTTTDVHYPKLVMGLPAVGQVTLSHGSLNNDSTAVLTTGGNVYAWGGNEKGQLGIGTTTNATKPTRVGAFSGSGQESTERATLSLSPMILTFTWTQERGRYDRPSELVYLRYAQCTPGSVSGDGVAEASVVDSLSSPGTCAIRITPMASPTRSQSTELTFTAKATGGASDPAPVKLTVKIVVQATQMSSYVLEAPYGGLKAPSALASAPETSNVWADDYDPFPMIPNMSSLKALADGTYERAEYDKFTKRLVVETYGSDFKLKQSREVPRASFQPAPLASDDAFCWGGLYQGTKYNYVLTGQTNHDESDDLYVLRLTQYDLDWNYLGNLQLRHVNTYEPFRAGTVAFAEDGNRLYVRSCHEIYNIQGLNHQTNLTLLFDQSPLSLTGSQTGGEPSHTDYGYVSHSFNQFVQVFDGFAYGLDHGDGYPRAMRVNRFDGRGLVDASGRPTDLDDSKARGDIFTITDSGSDQPAVYNITKATLNDFTSSKTKGTLLTLGTSINQDHYFTATARNVWLAQTRANDLGNTKITWITSYAENGTSSALAPHLVKITDDRFLVIWGVDDPANFDRKTCTSLHYVFVDATGARLSQEQTVTGRLSDCDPVVGGGKVVWYVAGDGSWGQTATLPTFYEIDATTGAFASHAVQPSGAVPVYRLYNEWSGEHIFTKDASEKNALTSIGWKDEGVGWKAPAASSIPIYRLFNPYTKEHLYTTNRAEYDQLDSIGWNGEGVKLYGADATGKPAWRLFNPWEQGPSPHFYTANPTEYRELCRQGWRDEGICWYGLE